MASRGRVVRRTPLTTRVKAYLNPLDFLLWISEELNSNDWDDFQEQWAASIGLIFNILFMVARSNASSKSSTRGDDIFGDHDERKGNGWMSWMASFIVHFLTLVSFLNAFFVFYHKRYYRLFESDVNVTLNTSSARRVRVDSSPIAASPLKYFAEVLSASSAAGRAHPDSAQDVWEVGVWDPNPLCLRLLCLFSPGHVLFYWLFLPLAPLDPRPSVTVITTIILATVLTLQLTFLRSSFSQQAKDTALINKEVQNEYDTKYVHPSLNKPVRDAGTQYPSTRSSLPEPEVLTYTPTTYVNRGFKINPNPDYSPHYDPENVTQRHSRQPMTRTVTTPNFLHTPNASMANDLSSPLRQMPSLQPSQPRSTSSGDGGSMGVYTHAYSPLRKPSMDHIKSSTRDRSPAKREGSPLKRQTTPIRPVSQRGLGLNQRFSQLRGEGARRDSGHL